MAWLVFDSLNGLSRQRMGGRSESAVDSAVASGRWRSFAVRTAFFMIVLLPTSCAALYYSLIAAPRYVSEAQFLVRGVNSNRVTGLDAFFRVFGISRAVDDTNIVETYILSRDAVAALQRRLPLRKIFARPEGDYLAKFPRFWEKNDFESLYRFYLQRVSVTDDGETGISTLRVVTFRPEDSAHIARELLHMAEEVANRMNLRAERDTIVDAQKQVDVAEESIIAAQSALTSFRNRSLLIDPEKNSDAEMGTIATLWSQLTQTLAQIRENSITAPDNPQLSVWLAKVDALRGRIAAERERVRGAGEALGAKVSDYEKLTLARDLADKSLAAAIDSLEVARQDARRQQIYVEDVSTPNVPDDSREPQRLRMIATVFVFSFAIFSVLWIMSVGAHEHKH